MIASDSFVLQGSVDHEFPSLLTQEEISPLSTKFPREISPGDLVEDKGLLCLINILMLFIINHVPGVHLILNDTSDTMT